MNEIWKDIEGYEGKYQVSNLGNVKSLNFNNTKQEKILQPKINRYGYREVKLSKYNKTKNYLVSTLVGKAFFKQKNADKEIMHIKDTNDDSLDNLKYGYRSEILYQMYKKGHRKEGVPSKYKITYEGKAYRKLSDMARDYNIEPKLLNRRIRNGWTLDESLSIPKERKQRILNVQMYKYNNKLMSVKQLAEEYNIDSKLIYKRLKRGWSIEEAIEIPTKKRKEKV